MSKRLSKYIASFHYIDKSLIVLSVATGNISIASFATAIGADESKLWRCIFSYYRVCKKVFKNNKK